MATPTDRNRFEVEVKEHAHGPYVQVFENFQNPDGEVVRFPAFHMRVEEAQELLMDLAVAVIEVQGFVQFTRISEDEAEFRQADDSIGGSISS